MTLADSGLPLTALVLDGKGTLWMQNIHHRWADIQGRGNSNWTWEQLQERGPLSLASFTPIEEVDA